MRTVDNDFSNFGCVPITIGCCANVTSFIGWCNSMESQIVGADLSGSKKLTHEYFQQLPLKISLTLAKVVHPHRAIAPSKDLLLLRYSRQ